jgi:hypothetical protein
VLTRKRARLAVSHLRCGAILTCRGERNARLKAHNAELEFQYKNRRLDEDKSIADKELEVARARALSDAEDQERAGIALDSCRLHDG